MNGNLRRVTIRTPLAPCLECGLVSAIPAISGEQNACCPRCGHTLFRQVIDSHQKVLAIGTTCLVLLAISLVFPFMTISVQGLSHHIVLLNALSVFHYFDNNALAVLLVLTVILLPAFYVLALMVLFVLAAKKQEGDYPGDSWWVKQLLRFVFRIEHWLLVDIFLVGVLVSIVKIAAMTDVVMGESFWAFMLFTLMLVKISRATDRHWLYHRLFRPMQTGKVKAGDTHLSQNHTACRLCHCINIPDENGDMPDACQRCHSALQPYNPEKSLTISAALAITALVLYAPANLYAMMYTISFGSSEASTIMDGVILLWQLGSYPIALVILTASVIVPLTKMLILFHLLMTAKTTHHPEDSLAKLKLYRFIEFIGRWSMIDVFVVALLAALVQFNNLMSISPGPAVAYFALVVIFTLIATMIYDPRALWTQEAISPATATKPATQDLPNG